jgi:hypothetical protein
MHRDSLQEAKAEHPATTLAIYVTRILLLGGVSVSDMYQMSIHVRYAVDTFPAVSQKV